MGASVSHPHVWLFFFVFFFFTFLRQLLCVRKI